MDSPSSTGVPQHWREERSLPATGVPSASSGSSARGMKIFILLALMLALVGFIGGFLSWLGPPPSPYFLPLWVTEYQARQIPLLPMAQRDLESLQAGQYFTTVLGDAAARQDGHQMMRDLDGLRDIHTDQGVIVYLRAHAVRAGTGEVYILPGDASPDHPATWIKLHDILGRVRECPSRKKLIVLDIASALPSLRLGVLYHDVASAIPAELDAAPDPDRLVLCSASPGQTSFVSEELGRSIFSYYFEEGLKGYAEAGYTTRGADAQVTVQELASFVRARVDRWSMRNRGMRQTPVLYGRGADFPLVALEHGEPLPHQPELVKLSYPKPLFDAWKTRDAWWQQDTFRLAPRAFTQVQTVLLEAERDWRAGYTSERIKENLLRFYERAHADLQRSTQLVQPVAFSLAQQAAQGSKSDDKLTKLLHDWLNGYARQIALAKPEEVSQVRAKLVDDVREKIKDATPFALDQAVFRLADNDGRHDPGTLRVLEQLLQRPTQLSAQTVETQLLAQLAELAGRTEPMNWPADQVGRVLEVVQKGERAASDPRVFDWIRPWLEEAAQFRHDGEVRLWARGYAPLEDVDRLLRNAGQSYDAALQQAAKVNLAQRSRDEALATLPFYPLYLESHANLHKTWESAGQTTRGLVELLRSPPELKDQDDSHRKVAYVFQLGDRIEALGKSGARLQETLRELDSPFTSEQVQRLVKLSKQPRADGKVYLAILSTLSVPQPSLRAEDRAALWEAGHALAKRLVEDTLQLDRDDNQRGQATAAPDTWDDDLARLQEQARAKDRGQAALAILELGGLPSTLLRPLREALDKATQDSTPQNWCKAGAMLRQAWSTLLPMHYFKTEDAIQREQMSWILPGLDTYRVVDEAEVSPATQVRSRQTRQLWTWLSDYYRYRARDYQGLGLDSPALSATRQFFARAALANQDLVRLGPEAYVALHPATTIPALTPERATTTFELQVQRVLPEESSSVVDVVLQRPDFTWLQVSPDSARLPGIFHAVTGPRKANATIPVQVSVKPGAERSGTPRPDGILAQANLGSRTFHRLVPIPLQGLSQDLQILLSSNPKEPDPPLQEIRLRPGRVRQNYYLFVKNATPKNRKVVVEVVSPDGLLASAAVTVAAQETTPVRLEDKGPPSLPTKDLDKASLPEVQGPLEIRLRDVDQQTPILTSKLRVGIASPREYVAVTDIRFDPAGPTIDSKNKLTVRLQALGPISGPPIPADLVFPARRMPGFIGVEGGTFHGEIPNKQPLLPLTLFAEKIQSNPGGVDEGIVYVNIDGVDRSFIFRGFFGRAADPSMPRGDGRPAVRILTEPFAQASATFTVPIETDNAPAGASLEVSLGRLVQNVFEADAVRRFPDARLRTIGLATQKGALVFEAAVRDWQAVFDTTRILGQRILRARLLDETGIEIQQVQQSILIASSSPGVVRFLDPPAKVKRGSTIDVRARAQDTESGIAQVTFFLGKPVDGKIPPGATTFAGVPVDVSRAVWAARIPLPADTKGPIPVSVQFVNKIGLASFDSTAIEQAEVESEANGPGKITGKVVEGPRAQPNVEVVLRDLKGVEKARTKTKADGSFTFDNVKPGRYSLFSIKPDSQRRATVTVTVEPNKTAAAALNLSL